MTTEKCLDDKRELSADANAILEAFKEIYFQQKWFSKYDSIIFQIRGWFVSMMLAIVIFLMKNESNRNVIIFIFLFSFWAMSVELIWLYSYWTKRSLRHIKLINLINKKSIDKLWIMCDFTDQMDNDIKSIKSRITNSHALPRIFEIIYFYTSIIFLIIILHIII